MRVRGLKSSIELQKVLEDAEEMADAHATELSSVHLLLALLTDDKNLAQSILDEHKISHTAVFEMMRALDVAEPVDTIAVVLHKTEQFATSVGAENVGTLHLLAGLCRVHLSSAFQVIERLGARPGDIRTTAIRLLTTGGPRRYRFPTATPHADRVDRRRSGEPDLGPQHRRGVVAVVEPIDELEDPEPDEVEVEALPVLPERRAEPVARTEPPAPRVHAERARRSRYALDRDTFPVLNLLGRNVTLAAELGELDPVVGRTREIEQLVDILNKRRSNNPCLLGDPGVGKTAIVEGLAQRIVHQGVETGALGEKIIIELQMGTLLAGTQLRGAFSERLRALKEEVARADGRVVLFIDEIHTLIGLGAGDGALDAANELKTALARGEFPCIGCTTEREFRRHVESDPALERRFQVVLVDEPDLAEALEVVKGQAKQYAAHHRVEYRTEAMEAAVRLSHRWIFERCLPAKAVDVLDLAGAFAVRTGRSWVGQAEVAEVVATQAKVPRDRLLVADAERVLGMEGFLRERIVAHDDALARIARVLRVRFAGFGSRRPLGSFLLLGPTGVGKTECAKVLAEFLFGSRDAVLRFDMTEYVDAHSLSRLIGAPPGYVGHDQGGQLTEAVRRRPYQVVLFDEIEKAAPEVQNVLLQLLEEGLVTDGRGRRVRFSNTVVVLTSNLGQSELNEQKRQVGFNGGSAAVPLDRALDAARKALAPELWNRIDEKLVFRPLVEADVRRIARLLLEDSSARLKADRGVTYTANDDVVDLLLRLGGFDARFGARPMRRKVAEIVEAEVADALLSGRAGTGKALHVRVSGDRVTVDATA